MSLGTSQRFNCYRFAGVQRTEATIQGPQGVFKVTKGAVHIIMKLVHNGHEIESTVDEKVQTISYSTTYNC